MRWRKYFWPLMLPLQIVVLQIMSLFPSVVEKYFSNGIYRHTSQYSRIIFNWIPFSAGDICYILLGAYFLYRAWISRRNLISNWRSNLRYTLSVISIFYLVFNLLWGINYIRVPLSEKLKIGKTYTDAELLAVTRLLIRNTNQLQIAITGNGEKKVDVPYSRDKILAMNLNGYRKLGLANPQLDHDGRSVKFSLISTPLSYMGFSGYLNPFTGEAQVNSLLPKYAFPATAAHEMAHQIGYASESEANFVGYLATTVNDDLLIQYSGYCMAVRYCLAEWEYRDEEIFDQLLKTVNPGVSDNFRESREFWEKYETFIEKGFHLFYDNFLKLNQQEEGMESYNKFVDLLVNYHK